MTAHELLVDLQSLGFTLRPLPGGYVEVRPKSKLTDALRDAIRSHKPALISALTNPVEQQELWQPRRTLPPIPPAFKDADYWTQRCNAVLAKWRRKDWGPCHRCGQTAWYKNMGFSLCGICTPLRNYSRTEQ